MNCPHCGAQMEQGHLAAGGHRILWTPQDRRLSTWKQFGDAIIESPGFFGELHNTAHICKTCQTVIVDY